MRLITAPVTVARMAHRLRESPSSGRRVRAVIPVSLTAVTAVLLLLIGGFGLNQRNAGLDVSQDLISNTTPVTVLQVPDLPQGSAPIAVIVHGYTASSVIVGAAAEAIARAGFVVVVPDLPGHGRHVGDVAPRNERLAQLDDELDDVIGYARSLPAADSRQLHLVGHSLGALAALRAAARHEVASIVSISTPSADDVNRSTPTLLMYGSLEPESFVDAADDAAAVLRDAGTRHEVRVIDRIEHVGIIVDARAISAMLTWLGVDAVDVPLRTPLLPLALAMLGLALLAGPAVRLAIGSPLPAADGEPIPAGVSVVMMVGASAVGALAASAFPWVEDAFPLEVGGWLVTYFLVAGIVLWLGWGLTVHRMRSAGRLAMRPGGDPSVLRTTVGTMALTAVLVLVLAFTARASWASFELVGQRRTALPIIELALITFFMAEALLIRGGHLRRLGLALVVRLVIVASLVAGVTYIDAPRILTIQVPLIAVLLLLTAWWGHAMARSSREPWAVAVVQGVPIAYVMATALPLH
jgi:pimeloyl-ACP methyl ester carboxylesterase